MVEPKVPNKNKKQSFRRIEDLVGPECILSALFLLGAFFFLFLGLLSTLPDSTTTGAGGATSENHGGGGHGAHVSVDRVLTNIKDHIPQRLRHLPQFPLHRKYSKATMSIDEVIASLDSFISKLHKRMKKLPKPAYEGEIWKAYFDLAKTDLYPWDQEYLARMPKRREDDSIFLSVASYRDENCFKTLYNAYHQAKNPEKLNIGLVQQTCNKQ